MASGLFHHHRHQSCERAAKNQCHPKFFLFVYLLLLAAIQGAAVPQPRAKSSHGSLDLSHAEISIPKLLTHGGTGPIPRIIVSPSERVRLHSMKQDHEQSRIWSYRQMKGKVHNYPGRSHQHTRRSTRRRVLSAEHTSEAEEAHSHEEAVGEQGHEEADEEDESEEEEETEEEGGEEEHSEEGEGVSSTAETEHHHETNEDVHKEGEHSSEEITKTIRAAAEEESEEARSAQETAVHDIVKEDIPATNNQEPTTDERSKTDGVSKNRNIFRGIPGGAVDGTNITQVSLMVYKLVKAHKIKKVVDIPCRNNLSWFPALLERFDFEIVGFKYMCVDKGADKDTQLHSHFTDAGSPEFYDVEPKQAAKLPKSDLVLSFGGPQQWGVRKTWSFFLGLRKSRPKYIIVTNNPGQKNNGEENTLNLRQQPFHFTQPKRVISNVETEGKPKQLVFYDIQNVRHGF